MLEQVELRDGTQAWVTALVPSDRHQLAAEFAGLSDETRRQRFLSPVSELSEAMLNQLVDGVDGINHIALVLTVETTPHTFDPVALARIVRYPEAPDCADLAVTVKDEWQGKGVASALLDILVRQRPEGVRRILTEVSSENAASMAMLRRLGPLTSRSNGFGAEDVEITLTAALDDEVPVPRIELVTPGSDDRPEVDRAHREHLHTRDLLCPWLN